MGKRLMESHVLCSAGNKERELRGSAQQSASSVKEGSRKPASQRPDHVAPPQGGRVAKGESRALITGGIFMAFWSVLL